MEEEEINYKTLRKIQQMEKSSPVLSSIPPDFYIALSQFFKILNERLEKEENSQKKLLLEEEIQNTKKIALNIYEQREKKIILAAVSKARSGEPDLKNMIEAEKNLFDSVLSLMIKAREEFLEKEKNDDSKSKNLEEEKKEKEKKILEEKPEKNEIIKKNEKPIIRVIQDVPEFIGTDGNTYNLRKNDILSIPQEMSTMLIKKGVAEEINSQ